MDISALAARALRLLPPEKAHMLAMRCLRLKLPPRLRRVPPSSLRQHCLGLDFASPLGLAAGFDKNAEAVNGLLAQGFGFVEVGTVTPLPQPGNPLPRLFRLESDLAIVNRLGFNNEGLQRFTANLRAAKRRGCVGANLGRNKDSLDAAEDYATGLSAVYGLVDYITINISSPNTVGLRDLQQKSALTALIRHIEAMRARLVAQHGARKPILYKIAPDLTEGNKEDIAALADEGAIDGLIIANTTISRPPHLTHPAAQETGGLSGAPLFPLATESLRDMYRLTRGKVLLIGVGGIGDAETAYAKIKAGASLLQLYTALIYQGFGLLKRIEQGLAERLAADGFACLGDAVGVDA